MTTVVCVVPVTGVDQFRQNYWTITGTLAEGSRSLELRDVSLENWKPAGPEPKSK